MESTKQAPEQSTEHSTGQSLSDVLDKLDPPLKHSCEQKDGFVQLTLTDSVVHQSVTRNLTHKDLQDPLSFQLLILYAVNEIRGLGSHAELKVLPLIAPLEIDRPLPTPR